MNLRHFVLAFALGTLFGANLLATILVVTEQLR